MRRRRKPELALEALHRDLVDVLLELSLLLWREHRHTNKHPRIDPYGFRFRGEVPRPMTHPPFAATDGRVIVTIRRSDVLARHVVFFAPRHLTILKPSQNAPFTPAARV